MYRPHIKVKQIGLLLVMLLNFAVAWAQNKPTADTTKVFSLEDLRMMVFRYHPIIKQAALFTQTAKANVLQSLGYFDPALKASFGSKMFGNTEYYNHWDSELKVPLWLAGADLKVGYDRNVGTYTNPETRTSLDGLTGVGISIPLGQGLIIDSRRNTLRQAKIMVQYAEAEQVKQVNGTWYEIVKDYWAWYYAYRQLVLSQEGVELAERRFKAVNTQTKLGDKASIDSVEAYITVQERIVQLDKNKVELQNARLLLSNHLWNEEGSPLELPADAIPQMVGVNIEKPSRMVLDTLVQKAANQHPELVKLRTKGSQLAVERSYRQEMLKPKINVSGTLLSKRRSFDSYVPGYYDYNWSNYKVGLDFVFPLFLRSERGKLREVKLKQQQLDYDIQQSGREIKNDVLSAYNDLTAYEAQINVQAQSVKNQEALLKGEMQKFELGESTLFLINSRETKLIDMRIKLESMIAGYEKSLAALYYKAGSRQQL
ncbi:TolC family protein [Mucilaginibacter sp. KACC 22063]|uniref:TolC family protein n=1 Tax=Mucilaginibacter sp. KACC 22063 TaxID=3025666 RepID=UPI002366C17D|nr:TolC family protein [Mucilaginibacter sp. KACC 22063]WDF53333.1 TolC family protein [Mucilaginibacter sp. KACC 22063]